jgi:hypothetical protein
LAIHADDAIGGGSAIDGVYDVRHRLFLVP